VIRIASLQQPESTIAMECNSLDDRTVIAKAADVHFDYVRARLAPDGPFALLQDVRGLSGHDSPGLPEIRRGPVERR
jgi:hypothetical protein